MQQLHGSHAVKETPRVLAALWDERGVVLGCASGQTLWSADDAHDFV